MSLMNTMTKLAVGFAIAKGVEAVNRRGGVGSVLEDLSTAAAGAGGGAGGLGNLGDLLGQLGGGGSKQGGLGDLLGQLGGSGQGGLGGLLGQLASAGGAAQGAGGLGALLGGLAGARDGGEPQGLEAIVNADNPANEPDEEDMARLMLRAMIDAARADGDLDAGEKSRLLEVLRDGDAGDTEALQKMLNEPVDPRQLAADTPRGLETQVYAMSVNAITPDNKAEFAYLNALAGHLDLSREAVNRIHKGLGVPPLYV